MLCIQNGLQTYVQNRLLQGAFHNLVAELEMDKYFEYLR